MQINNVSNVQFCGISNISKKSNNSTETKCETSKTDKLEKDLDKMDSLGRSLVKKIDALPPQMDFALRKAASQDAISGSKKILAQFALAYRYGNRPDAKLDEDVLSNLKKYFEEQGQEFDEKDIKIMVAGDSSKEHYAHKVPLYHDESTGLTTVFTKEGLPDYKICYETGFGGKLTDVSIVEIYSKEEGKWIEK